VNPLSVQAISPATLSALSALKPVRALAGQDASTVSGTAALSVQELAQGFFRQNLQAAAQSVVEPATGANLVQEVAGSLLASLTAPQAATDTTPTAGATTNPSAVQAPGSNAGTTASAAALADLPATQDAFATSSSVDFALQTALRFGAGVGAPAAATPAAADLGTGLIRDAAAVQRLENLQPRAGGPGPEAFAQPQRPVARALRTYEAAPAAQGTGKVDLFA
jgi:hypothetical protein